MPGSASKVRTVRHLRLLISHTGRIHTKPEKPCRDT